MYTENSFIGSGLNIQLPLACSFTIEKIYNGLMLPIFRDSKTIVVHFEPHKNNLFVVAAKKNFRASKFKRNSIQKDIFSVGRERIITLTRETLFFYSYLQLHGNLIFFRWFAVRRWSPGSWRGVSKNRPTSRFTKNWLQVVRCCVKELLDGWHLLAPSEKS